MSLFNILKEYREIVNPIIVFRVCLFVILIHFIHLNKKENIDKCLRN